jgi:2,4'-dihydroxyacetophenone dioxygenase
MEGFEQGVTMRQISDTAVSDALVSAKSLPWVEQAPGVFFKPLRLSPKAGTWANILRVETAGQVSRHRHLGAVQAWVLAGSWRYLEHDWVAHPGDFVFEGAGDVHTLVVEAGEPMETLFVIDAPYEYLDAEGNVTGVESAESKLALYRRHCEANGLEIADIVY